MPLFRKSKLPEDIPVPTPTSPAERVQNRTPRRESRTVTASSTAVALPVGSTSDDTRDTPGEGAAVQGSNMSRQTPYNTGHRVPVLQGVYERTREINDDIKNIRGDTKNLRGDTENIRGDTKEILEAADLEILAKLEPVRNAGYQAGHHDKCLPGTRESVLRDVLLWAKNPQDQNVFWLNGLAGTGKSTIAQSFSEAAANSGLLGASFFCSRDYLERRELKNIFPTLAYQLACRYPRFRSRVVRIIREDPTLAHTSLISQLENLLVNPLSGKNISCVIIIDALDECIDDQPASAILSVLGRFAKQLPLVKFFITGRPEPRIRSGFRLPLLGPLTQVFLLHEVESSSVDDDIKLYLTQRLTAIAKQRSGLDLPDPWPCDNEIVALAKKSSGLFIFASTLVRFVESEYHEPTERLQLVLSEASGTTHEGRTGIDSLYSQVLLHAFSDVRERAVTNNVRRVLGAIVLAFNPLSRKALSTILGLSTAHIATTLRHLHSVILVPEDEIKEIRIFHKSFPDFLQDDTRCTDPRFYVNPETHHGDMAISCLELVKNLKRNPCSLPPFTMNQDVIDLPQLLENKLGGAVRYTCRYWARHLELSSAPSGYACKAIVSVTEVLKSAAPWIEVMSLENRLEEVIHSMYGLQTWLDNVKPMAKEKANTTRSKAPTSVADAKVLTALAMDCLRLSMHFFHPIQQCAQQIYYTALPLSPTSSELRKHCLLSVAVNHLSRVSAFLGAPDTWGLLLRTIDIRPRRLTCITTFVQRIVAACEDIVYIYDAVTFVLRQSLHAPETVTKIQGSPDESTLFFSHSYTVTMWDVQTGGLTHTFTTQFEITDIAVSTTGHRIACGLSKNFVASWNTHTKEEDEVFKDTDTKEEDKVSKNTRTKEGDEGFGESQPVVTVHWLSPLKLAIVTQRTIYIHHIAAGQTARFQIPGRVWGMISLGDTREPLVGTSQPSEGARQKSCFVMIGSRDYMGYFRLRQTGKPRITNQSMYLGGLSSPTLVSEEIACITPPSGVQLFDIKSLKWTHNPPLLDAATSVAVSLNRNLVVQAEDSIQIFSLDVLKSGEGRNNVRTSHVYPLGGKHIICLLQQNRRLTILDLDTLRKLHPNDTTSLLRSLPANKSPHARASFSCGFVAEFGISVVMQAWRSGTPLPEWAEASGDDPPLSGLSPSCTRIATLYSSPWQELCVKDVKAGTILAKLPLEDDLGTGKVYDVTFDSETRFYLRIEGLGQHIQIPHDIIPSPTGPTSHRLARGEPTALQEPRATPPYTLDVNCEWVVDAKSRKICWISPGNVRRGNGGHFWAGLSLVMVGDDGVVRKLSFREPDSN